VSKIIAGDLASIREKFTARTFSTFKSVKKAFVEWKSPGKNFIEFENFKLLMESWGFKNDCHELFDWLDFDKDGLVSFNDLRQTVGVEIAPMEQFFFRQDIKSSKNIPCNFMGCWQNLLY
jgi:Ca2+-binding EF-hand superfamily protein